MSYDIKYNNDAKKASDDMEWYISSKQSDILAESIVRGCNYRQMRFMASFTGVQGYPVTCWMRETKELYATW